MGIFADLFSGSKKSELAVVFDIGSSSVSGALFLIEKSRVPKIIFSVHEEIAVEEEMNPDRFLSLTINALGRVAEKISLSGLGAPRDIFCVLSSPWYVSQTRIIKVEKDTPFIFTTKLANEFMEKEINLFEKEYLASYLESGHQVRRIEIKTLKTLLNGYQTSKPLNQKINSLEMLVFISMSGEQVLEKIEEVMFKYFHLSKVTYTSFVLAAFTVVRDLFIHKEDFLLIDIGGEMTDISMIKKGVLRESASFPLGPNFMIRGVARDLGVSIPEAKSYISLYKDNHAENETLLKLERSISGLKKEWLKSFQDSLATFSKDISIPASVFMTVDKDLAQFFSDIIKAEQFNQYILTESKFEVVFLSTQTLHGIIDFGENVARDPFLTIESIYINRFLW